MQNHSSLNGHDARAVAPIKLQRVEVFRCTTFEPIFVRMLSESYKGLFTHYIRGRSQYCPGKGCKYPNCETDRTWKGYVAAEWMMEQGDKALYIPCCFEITEYLELDMRGVYERGQLWEIWKLAETKGKQKPVTGKVNADPKPDGLRRPFDILPCLRALYHRDIINLVHPSPCAARVFMAPVECELPQKLQPKPAEELYTGDIDLEKWRKEQRDRATQKTSPTDKERAKPYAR